MCAYKPVVLQQNDNIFLTGTFNIGRKDRLWKNYHKLRLKYGKEEFSFLIQWKQAKGQFVIAHHKWIKSILDQMKEIKVGLKGYKYLDEALELCTELGLNITDAEIIRTNSTGLVIYNPKNLAERIKGMKNKNVSRADKIKARLLYEAENGSVKFEKTETNLN